VVESVARAFGAPEGSVRMEPAAATDPQAERVAGAWPQTLYRGLPPWAHWPKVKLRTRRDL
jgi:hypothetical protein